MKRTNKSALLFVTLLLIFTIVSPLGASAAASVQAKTAVPTTTSVLLDGKPVQVGTYTVDGVICFGLRDVAYMLNGTIKQFEVTYTPETNGIDLFAGLPYTAVGSEMSVGTARKSYYVRPTDPNIWMNGQKLPLESYFIYGSHYLNLYDLGKALDFGTECNAADNTATIETLLHSYNVFSSKRTADNGVKISTNYNSHANSPRNFYYVPRLHQFEYCGEGMGYAADPSNPAVKNGRAEIIEVILPDRVLNIERRYDLLGDVIADGDGNIYFVWGLKNTTDKIKDTVYITKYSPDGRFIAETGFDGRSSPWGDDKNAKTKIPFNASGISTVISENGILVSYFGKERYDGHQSDIALAVDIKTMKPYTLKNETFSGHSFGQSVIWCEQLGDFLFASLGDAYPRGFNICTQNDGYGRQDRVTFTCYLQSNADYNMTIVNKTFAQLGGIIETDGHVMLVGASARSLGKDAENECQNLFIQIFNPDFEKVNKDMFVGGKNRTGSTSFDINDDKNSPLTSVTDYGVIWLTDYTDQSVVCPQVVKTDDGRAVILWSTQKDSYYMVLNPDGSIHTEATSLNSLPLNSVEKPVYHDGCVTWVYSARTDKKSSEYKMGIGRIFID